MTVYILLNPHRSKQFSFFAWFVRDDVVKIKIFVWLNPVSCY